MKRSRSTMPLSDLSPEQRAHVAAQLGQAASGIRGQGDRRDSIQPQSRVNPHGPAPKRSDGYRSKAESDYAAWLDTQPGLAWSYEAMSIALPGKGTRARPDFWVARPRGDWWSLECVEVKGTKDGRPFWRGEAPRLRALTAAAELRKIRVPLYVAWFDSGWRHELVEVRP